MDPKEVVKKVLEIEKINSGKLFSTPELDQWKELLALAKACSLEKDFDE